MFFLMIRRPPGPTRTDTLCPYTTRFRSDRPLIRSDGTMVRDYLYVVDGALAYLRLVEAMAEDPAVVGEAFNFSTETPLTVLELVAALQRARSEEHTSELQSLMRISYAVFCLKKKTKH